MASANSWSTGQGLRVQAARCLLIMNNPVRRFFFYAITLGFTLLAALAIQRFSDRESTFGGLVAPILGVAMVQAVAFVLIRQRWTGKDGAQPKELPTHLLRQFAQRNYAHETTWPVSRSADAVLESIERRFAVPDAKTHRYDGALWIEVIRRRPANEEERAVGITNPAEAVAAAMIFADPIGSDPHTGSSNVTIYHGAQTWDGQDEPSDSLQKALDDFVVLAVRQAADD